MSTRLLTRSTIGALAESLVTPLMPADYLDLVAPLRAKATLRGRVVGITAETTESATLTLRPGAGWLGHEPGQYLRVGVDIDGVRHWRAYSLTSTIPGREDKPGKSLISITVKAMPDGLVSNYLVHRLAVGELVHLAQATGEFLAPAGRAPVVAVTAGSGITPVMGMIRNGLAEQCDVVVVHSAPTAEGVIFGAELRARAEAGELRLIERHTDREGMLDVADLQSLIPDLAERTALACGPVGLLNALEDLYATLGLEGRLFSERFRPALVVTGDGGEITFTRSGSSTTSAASTALLDAGEAADVLMPSGCRMGICYGCVLPLTSGAVRDLRDGSLTTANDGDAVLIQTCISAAAGPCELDV